MIITKKLSVKYSDFSAVDSVDINIYKNKITSIIGPNGCGKSTLLRALANMIGFSGTNQLNNKQVTDYSRKELSRLMSVLAQKPTSNNNLSVKELVSYGRNPYIKRFASLSKLDLEKIEWAMQATNIIDFQDRNLDSLSGGQRQRVWIALSLAQDTDLILLDEPTTYLDISFQLEILEILLDLKQKYQKTILMVLHDLNQASKYSDQIIAMKDGKVIKTGTSEQIITQEILQEIFGIKADIRLDEKSQKPMCLTYSLVN